MSNVVVGAAVVDVDDFAGEAVRLGEPPGDSVQMRVEAGEPLRLVMQRHHDGQAGAGPFRRAGRASYAGRSGLCSRAHGSPRPRPLSG